MDIENLHFPLDRKYHRSHLWVKSEGDKVKIGIDDFLSNMAGYINYLTIDRKDIDVKSGESFGSLESGKFVSKIYTPTSGKIVEVNQDIINNPRKISDDPYDAWIIQIQPEDNNKFDEFLEKEQDIRSWIAEEMKKYEEEESG